MIGPKQMNDKAPTPRFIVRQGPKNFMVYDRAARGPARMTSDRLAVGLSKGDAETLRDQLAVYTLRSDDGGQS